MNFIMIDNYSIIQNNINISIDNMHESKLDDVIVNIGSNTDLNNKIEGTTIEKFECDNSSNTKINSNTNNNVDDETMKCLVCANCCNFLAKYICESLLLLSILYFIATYIFWLPITYAKNISFNMGLQLSLILSLSLSLILMGSLKIIYNIRSIN